MTDPHIAQPKPPGPPRGTKAGGRRLWKSVVTKFDLDEHELALLREAVRTIDALDALATITARDGLIVDTKAGPRAHPAAVEARQLRVTLARIVAALRLPADEDESAGREQRRGGARGVYELFPRGVAS